MERQSECEKFFFWLCCVTCGLLAPWPGMKPMPPEREGRVLTTGPPGKPRCERLTRWKQVVPQVLVQDGRVSEVSPNSLARCAVQRVPEDRQGRTACGQEGVPAGGRGRGAGGQTHTRAPTGLAVGHPWRAELGSPAPSSGMGGGLEEWIWGQVCGWSWRAIRETVKERPKKEKKKRRAVPQVEKEEIWEEGYKQQVPHNN